MHLLKILDELSVTQISVTFTWIQNKSQNKSLNKDKKKPVLD